MLKSVTRRHSLAALITLSALLQLQSVVAENLMQLKRNPDKSITLELTNSDAIAGFQFSVQGRGGSVWGTYEGSNRTSDAKLAIYQYPKDDSTLNVVLLAPYQSALASGRGTIGKITFTLRSEVDGDTVSAFLSGIVICDVNAQSLDVSAEKLVWNRLESNDARLKPFTFEQNYPNPFNPTTTIVYKLERPASVQLAVYDVAGRLITSLVSDFQTEGRHAVQWNAVNDRGSKLSSGMYFARLLVDGQVAITKMILTR